MCSSDLLRNEIMGEFIDGLKGLFAEHYIDMPEEKIDVVESLAAKVEELETKLDEQITENASLKEAFVEVERENVFESYLDDLALSQQEKFKALAEGIEFDGDVEVYAKNWRVITLLSGPHAGKRTAEPPFKTLGPYKTLPRFPVTTAKHGSDQ